MDHIESIRTILRNSYADSPQNISSLLHWLVWDLSHTTMSDQKLIVKLQVVYNLTDPKTNTAKSIENYLAHITNEAPFYY